MFTVTFGRPEGNTPGRGYAQFRASSSDLTHKGRSDDRECTFVFPCRLGVDGSRKRV